MSEHSPDETVKRLRRMISERSYRGKPLSARLVARILGLNEATVYSWLSRPGSTRWRAMPERYLAYLDALLTVAALRDRKPE